MSYEARLSRIEKLLETSAKMIVRHDKEMADLREQTNRNAELIERNTQNIDRNVELIERNTQNIDRSAELIERNTQNIVQVFDLCVESIKVIKSMQSQVAEMQSQVAEMQSQVRGIQTENQRLMRHLFGDE